MAKKFLDLDGLSHYNGKVQESIDGRMAKDGSNYVAGQELVTPVMTHKWIVDGEEKTDNPLKLENGYKATLEASYKWTAVTGKKSPTALGTCDFSKLTASGVASDLLTIANIEANKTVKVVLTAPAGGLRVSGDRVVAPSGNDTTQDSVSVQFFHRIYYGCSTDASITTLAGLQKLSSVLQNSKAKSLTSVTTSANQYYYFAYPASLGDLSAITLNGSVPALGSFTKTTATITNGAGKEISYNIYRLNNIGALTNSNTLDIK